MNDNEKAASFIGWRECPNPKHNWIYSCDSHLFHCYGCGREDSIFARIHLPAPDMSKPDNYMRALEGILRADSSMSWPSGFSFHCPAYENGKIKGTWRVDIQHKYQVKGIGAEKGLAAREAIARYYDKQQQENA